MPRSAYERYVAMLWLRRRWWLIVLPVAAAAITAAALADVRWLLVALMYMFIVTPGIISIAYFRYLLTPEARLTALPKVITITPGKSIEIEYSLPDHLQQRAYDADDDADRYWLPANETISWDDVVSIKISGGNYAIRLKPSPHPRFLLVPRKALGASLPFELITI